VRQSQLGFVALLIFKFQFICDGFMFHEAQSILNMKPHGWAAWSRIISNRLVVVEFLSLALFSQAALCARATAQDLHDSQVDIAYVEPKNPSFLQYYETLKGRQVLEQLREFLSPLRLPRKILVKTSECGRETVPYQSGQPITVCYEYVARIVQLAPATKTPSGISRDAAITGATVQLVFHETAHVVFDLLQVPVWGREEDAADKLAAFVMLQFGKDVAITTLTGAIWFFEASNRTWTGSDFAQESSPEAQRFYNYLCIAYGGDPVTFTDIVRDTLLNTRRARRCADEYRDLSYAFTKTILPHIDPDRLRKVQSIRWLKLEN
jgi:hypothetical protein